MGSYTVGFDFGTHQTKICIEKESNHISYEFLEFSAPGNRKTLLFPSIVQINEDDTVSYGFVDDAFCKVGETIDLPIPPKPQLLEEKELQLPPEPVRPKLPPEPMVRSKDMTWQEQLQYAFYQQHKLTDPRYIAWDAECVRLMQEYNHECAEWARRCEELKKEHESEQAAIRQENADRMSAYEAAVQAWEIRLEKSRTKKLRFRYFKLAALTKATYWDYQIQPSVISVWYITYVLFLIKEHIPGEFYLQFGVPTSGAGKVSESVENEMQRFVNEAHRLMGIYKSRRAFMEAKTDELLALTFAETPADCPIVLMPEAFAGLRAVTTQKRLGNGMNLLIDIGGGTTDIAFFTIPKDDQPNIHHILSFPQGLNYIFEKAQGGANVETSELQKLFLRNANHSMFAAAVQDYREVLTQHSNSIVEEVIRIFRSDAQRHGKTVQDLKDAMQDRYVIFCGGGGVHKPLHITVSDFSQIKVIDDDLLKIPVIDNMNIDKHLFPIIATAYGLSIPLYDEIKMVPLTHAFAHLPTHEAIEHRTDYGLMDD